MGVGGHRHVPAALPGGNRRVHGVVPNYAYVRPNFLYPKGLNRFRLNLAYTLHGVLPISFYSVLARWNVFLKWISLSMYFLDCSSSSASSSSSSCHTVWPIVDPFRFPTSRTPFSGFAWFLTAIWHKISVALISRVAFDMTFNTQCSPKCTESILCRVR